MFAFEIFRLFFFDVVIIKVLIVLNDHGKASGNARLWLSSEDDVNKVLGRHGEMMGNRSLSAKKPLVSTTGSKVVR